MSKRSRGTQNRGQQKRQGNRPPANRPATRPSTRASTQPLSQLDAAEEIAEDLVEGQPQQAARELRAVARSSPARSHAKPTGLLAAKAATEYVYVAQDLRHIVRVAGLLFAIMLSLWLVIEVL